MSGPTGEARHAPLQGVLWMAAAALCFSVSIGLVRHLSDSVSTFEIVFFRMVLGIIFMVPWLMRVGISSLRTTQFGMHCLRNGLTYVGMLAAYYSVTLITIADSTALQFTLPLFTLILAVIFLGEHVGPHRWLATVVGFAGALIIIRPGFAAINIGMLVAVSAAAIYGASDVATRHLSRRDRTSMIVFYSFVMQLPLGIGPAIATWVTPGWSALPYIAVFGLVAFAAQWCLTQSYSVAEASFVSPVLFLRLPFTAAIGFVVFSQTTDVWTWTGAAILFASTCYMARRESQIARAAAAGS